MKKLLGAILCFAVLATYAQTADEIIQKYATNMGGLEAYNKITTAKITGKLTIQGRDYPLTTQIINGKAMRTDVDVNGQMVNNVYNDEKGWKINPFDGAPTATEVTGEELVTLKSQAYIANSLMDYKKRGHQVELLGEEEVDGNKTFKIKLTYKDDGKITTYFISSSSYFLVKSISKRKIAGNEYDAETFYTDIKEVGNIKFSKHFIQKIQGTVLQEVKYEKIELNVPVDEKIFEMPIK